MKGFYTTINGNKYWILIIESGKKQILIRRQDSGTMLFMDYDDNTTLSEVALYVKSNEKYLSKIF